MNAPAGRTELALPQPHAAALPSAMDPERLISQAIDKGVDPATMERLLAMREKLIAERARNAFFEALSRFQSECPIIKKRKTAVIKSDKGEFSYKYAPLDHIVKVVSPLLTRHGLSYTIVTRVETDGSKTLLVAVCTVHHAMGHSEPSDFKVPVDQGARMNDMQKFASAQTYAKRYAFCNSLGILTGDGDDDGHAGGAKGADTTKGADEEGTVQDYPPEGFIKNLPKWKKLMEAGKKTPEQIIATVGSKYHFSKDQLTKIRAAAPAQQ